MKLIFATNNQNKANEIRSVLPESFSILTLKEAGIDIDIPEPHDTLEQNAAEKALTIYHLTNTNCFSEDTGLEVNALNGEPGVHSARYAGAEKEFIQKGSFGEKNIEKLLLKLYAAENRSALFRTVICLVMNGKTVYFEGTCNGYITHQPKGTGGFGYDSVFIPDKTKKTFAEMSMEEKNKYSHRRKAADKLVKFLKNLV